MFIIIENYLTMLMTFMKYHRPSGVSARHMSAHSSKPFDAKTMGEYMNYEKIVKLHQKCGPTPFKEIPINVKCYYNLMWWTCPNPFDIRRSESLKDQYDAGYYYVRCQTISLTQKDFNDKNNWNS